MPQNVYHLMGRVVTPLLVLSFVSNLAILISPLFMMQVLDRVIPSGNMATLLLLGGVALAAFGLQSMVEAARDLSLGRLARWAEREGTALALAPNAQGQAATIQHVATFSNFLAGPAAVATLGAPWIPIFLLALWILHPAFLILLLAFAAIFLGITMMSKALSAGSEQSVTHCARLEQDTLRTAAEAESEGGIAVLVRNIRLRFTDLQRVRHQHVDQAELATISRTAFAALLRNLAQVGALGVGAWLVTADLLSPGGMIAGSIIASKVYGTLESLMVQLPKIRGANESYRALSALPASTPEETQTVDMPSGALRAENLIVPRGGGAPPRLDRITFELNPGECLAIVGNAGSGKSTLLRALAGISPAPIGSTFLGDHEVRSLSQASLFEMVGYLPQCATFQTGTIAENISSFDPSPDSEKIIAAAKTAGVHGLICALPASYETDIGREPYLLSAGQVQRVALARAIYAQPRYLLMDEPNALLDAESERALGHTLLRLKKSGVTIVTAVHRSGILVLADKVMQLNNGQIADFGPKAEVLARLGMGGRQIELPILETSVSDLQDWIASQFTRAGDQGFRHKTQTLGVELLHFACSNCAQDTLSFARFAFTFLEDTKCELTMSEPATQDMQEKVDLVRSKLGGDAGSPVHLAPDEMRLARISKTSSNFEISSTEEGTQYRILIHVETEEIMDVATESLAQ